MPSSLRDLRASFRRKTLRRDATAGLVLGVESVPDGLASGLLAGVNPVSGLYAYLFGMVGGALFTSAALMAVQATGAMAIIVADVDLASRDDPGKSLFALSIVTGVVMIVAGVLRLGRVMRFVATSVMTGLITAVGLNIVLGQLGNFTGYQASGDNRVVQALELLTSFWRVDLATTAIGALTVVLIVALRRTRLGTLGLVVAVVAGSAVAAILGGDVPVVDDIADVPEALPFVTMPAFGEMLGLLVPALSLAFVGLVQGAAVSAGVPNPDGSFPDTSRDFVGQGAGNVTSGLFQGMPVGGSMSASSLLVEAGARTRLSMVFAGAVMAVVILAFGSIVGYVAMPSLAALLIVVGVGTIKPNQVITVARTGAVQLTVMATTFALTMVIPLQYAVLVGVAMSIVLHVIRQSTGLTIKRLYITADGRMREGDPPPVVPQREVVVLQPYGSIFFATAKALEDQLPAIGPDTADSVVILRVRGADEVGVTLTEVLERYARALRSAGSKLVLVTDNPRIHRQLRVTGALETLGEANFYRGTEWVGETVRRAHEDGLRWIERRAAFRM